MGQGVNFTIEDNGLGVSSPGSGNTLAVIGVSSTGTPYQPFQSPQPGPFVTQFGYGPGPELAAKIANDTGNDVIFVKAATVTAGSNSAVTATRVASSTSVVTLTGTPLDTYYGNVTVLAGGTIGTSGIQLAISLDAARTVYATANMLTATTFAIPNTGLTLNFAAGTLTSGDVFTWVSTEPKWSDATAVSAMQSLISAIVPSPVDVIVVGDTASGDASAFDSEMNTLFLSKRFCRLLTNARDALWGGTSTETEVAWMNSIETDFSTFTSVNGRTHVGGGHYNFISPISQTQFRRPLLFGAASRDSAVAIQVDLGRVLDGAIPIVLPALPDGFIYHDESVNAGLDANRFMSMWSLAGLRGLYIKNPNSMAAPGSDFKWLQYGHVVDASCVIAYNYFVKQLSNSVRVDSKTGFILPQDKGRMEKTVNALLATGLTNAGAVSSVTAVINGATNILSTSQLPVTISIVPLAYLKTINVTITFLNPALVQVSSQIGA